MPPWQKTRRRAKAGAIIGPMFKKTVFRFRYFDRPTGSMRLAEDWATAEAIAHMGAEIEPGSAMQVEGADVSVTSGLLIVKRGAA